MAFRRKVEFKNHEPQFPAPLEGYAATVELPEGHHVTIGELTPGTIVEVATWNGTGKPDESTKRFLISADGTGLSRRVVNQPEHVEAQKQAEITNQSFRPVEIANTQPISDPIFGSNSSSNANRFAETSQRKTITYEKSFSGKLLKAVGVPLLILVLFIGLFKAFGIGATVPTMGSKSFFGSSTNSIVFYIKGSNLQSGTPVVAKDKSLVVFGKYNGDVGNLSLFTINDSQFSVPKESLSGRGLLLVPYIGTVLKPLFN